VRTGQRAANVLISRRSHPDHHAVLLLNHDGFAKTLRLALPDLAGTWRVSEALSSTPLATALDAAGAVTFTIDAESPAVLLLDRP
jgi:hypothetical protein